MSLTKRSGSLLTRLPVNFLSRWMKTDWTLRPQDTSTLPLKPSHTSQKSDSLVYPSPQYPHCDQRVLHVPGICEYCDRHPDWQELRQVWGINFTDYDQNLNLLPDPAQENRTIQNINRWGGNWPSRK